MFKNYLTSIILSLVAVGGFLGVNIQNDLDNGISSFRLSYIGVDSVWADDCTVGVDAGCTNPLSGVQNTPGQNQEAEIQKMLNKLVQGINVILNILTIIVTPAIMLATWLMSPDWTAGDIFGLRPVFHSLWVTISNITYFIYAILLIFIALATIFNSQNYGYKAMLPKLALGIILVPLTWWGVQFVISLATYVTATVISIPAESVQKFKSNESFWDTPIIPEKLEFTNGGNPENFKCGGTVKCLKPSEVVGKAGGMFSPLLIYSFAVFKIQDIKNIKTTSDAVISILNIVHQGIIGIIMFIVYGLLVMALIFLLMMRAIKLWFYAIFSPLFTIKYVLGDKAFGDADKDGSMNVTEFIGLAFVPAVVCLALSFGLVIISAMIAPLDGANNPNNKCVGEVCTIYIMGTTENKIESRFITEGDKKFSQTTITIGGINYTWKGSVDGSEPANSGVKSALGATGNMFGKIIVDIIALVFIWIAFMAGKGISKAASAAIQPFEEMGKKIGDMGMSLPKYTPIPGTGGVSLAGANKIVNSASSAFETKSTEKAYESGLAKAFGVDKDAKAAVADQTKLKQALNDTGVITDNMLKELQGSTQKIISIHGLSSAQGKQALQDLAEILKKNGKISDTSESVDSAGNIKGKGLYILKGDINSSNKEISPTQNEIDKWKNKQKNPSNGEVDSGKNTTNNTFNIKSNGNNKYSLEGTNFALSSMSPEEIMKELNSKVSVLTNINQDTLKAELKEMGQSDSQIKELLEKIEKEKKKTSGTEGPKPTPAAEEPKTK